MSLLVVPLPGSGQDNTDPQHAVPRCEADVELVTPSDWLCRPDGHCTVCFNIADHDSDFVMRCVGGEETERRSLPTRAQFSICRAGSRRPA